MRLLKRRRSAGKPVDAVAEIEQRQAEIEGRGMPNLQGAARPAAPGVKAFFVLVLLMAAMAIGIAVWRWMNGVETIDAPATSTAQARVENLLPGLNLKKPPPPPPPPPPPQEPPPPLDPPPREGPGKPPGKLNGLVDAVVVDPVTQRRLTSRLRAEAGEGQQAPRSDAPAAPDRQADSGPMSERLKPMKLNAAVAGMLGDRDMLITQGAMIDCVQDTRLVSAQAGMITCHTPQDVLSTSGRVVLVDAGSKFIGYQQGVLAQGQPRIGIVWSRLETPKGVVIHLDSPGTGPLGEAGLDGEIDTHFGERFGGAILVSLISDFGSWATSRGGSDGNSIRFDSTGSAAQDAVSTVLDNSINIPATLYRNQGGRIGIYVARDLDFSSVYALRPVAP